MTIVNLENKMSEESNSVAVEAAESIRGLIERSKAAQQQIEHYSQAVSYTHLTLPTKRIV